MKEFDEEELDEWVARALNEQIESPPLRNQFKPLEDVPKAQLMINRQLILEMRDLEDTLNEYTWWSKVLSFAMIFLSLVLVGLGVLDLLTTLNIIP